MLDEWNRAGSTFFARRPGNTQGDAGRIWNFRAASPHSEALMLPLK
jgi:hypothetical protein